MILFHTCEHYSVKDDESCEMNECFICLENEEMDKNIIRLHVFTDTHYYKTCECDGWVHSVCLTRWYELQKRCPICRTDIHQYIIITTMNYSEVYSMFINKCLLFFQFLLYLYIFYFTIFISYHLSIIMKNM